MAQLIGRLAWGEPPFTATEALAVGIDAWLVPARWNGSAQLELAAPIQSLAGLPFALEWQISETLSPAQEWQVALALRQLVLHPQAHRLEGRPLLWLHDPERLSHPSFSIARLRLLLDPHLLILLACSHEDREAEGVYERTDRVAVQKLADGTSNYESLLFHAHHRTVGSIRWMVPSVLPPIASGWSGATSGRYQECLALSEAWAELRSPRESEALVLVENWPQHRVHAPERCGDEASRVVKALTERELELRSYDWGIPQPEHGALLIHGYHLDLLERWLLPLAVAQPAVDLYVSCPMGKLDEVRVLLQRQGWSRVLLVEAVNRGRDIAPFLIQLLPRAVEQGHPWIVKLHTKRSPQTPGGARWGEHLWQSLASPDRLNALDHFFRQPCPPAVVAPAGSVLPISVCLARNSERLLGLLANAGLDGRWLLGQRFVAGSMWAARAEDVSRVLEVPCDWGDFEPEAGQADGTLAHAWERLITAWISAGGKLHELEGDHHACPPFGHPGAAPHNAAACIRRTFHY